MSQYESEIKRRRTFAIISHPDAGKTTLTEKFLLYGGAIAQAGQVKGKKNTRAATSDWMEIEKQRGISVTSSVMQFQYEGFCINILDTPGHQDFSEDTYRTLMAADSAVMVIDAAKGVEAQTRKLFRVCAMRDIPIFTFINKMDRESRDPFELCEELEHELGIDTYAMNWPIGCGKEFKGVYDRQNRKVIHFTSNTNAKAATATVIEPDDPALADLIGQAEHDELAGSVLFTDSTEIADKVQENLKYRVPRTEHAERVHTSLSGTQSAIVLTDGLDQPIDAANAYAAEHLEIQTKDADAVVKRIKNAGAIFRGPYSPVPLGDYMSGSNHVLPTGGTARFAAGLGVHTFMKPVEVIEYDEEGLKALAARINAFAVSEDLPAHGECVLSRFVKDPYDKATLREQEKEAGLR